MKVVDHDNRDLFSHRLVHPADDFFGGVDCEAGFHPAGRFAGAQNAPIQIRASGQRVELDARFSRLR